MEKTYNLNLLSRFYTIRSIYANFKDFVIERKETNFSILLYQVQSFYVEVFYSGKENKISRLRSFSSINQLEPYLNNIDISGISLI